MRNAPRNFFHRSLSVNEVEDEAANVGHGSGKPTRASVSSPIGISERNNRVPRSFRYMRNKPRVISLKTPSYEHDGSNNSATVSEQNSGDKDRLAEEGRAANICETFDVFENELHPIIGKQFHSTLEL